MSPKKDNLDDFFPAASAATFDYVKIDPASGSTDVGSADLPSNLLDQDPKVRDESATNLFIQLDKDFVPLKPDITEVFHNILENRLDEGSIRNPNINLFINCTFHDSEFIQTQASEIKEWNQIRHQIDISKLKSELENLISELRQKEFHEDLAKITQAKRELDHANGSGMLKYLKKASKEVLKLSKEIGLSTIVQLLSQSISG